VALAALLHSRAPSSRDGAGGGKVVVFLSTCAGVEFHHALLASAAVRQLGVRLPGKLFKLHGNLSQVHLFCTFRCGGPPCRPRLHTCQQSRERMRHPGGLILRQAGWSSLRTQTTLLRALRPSCRPAAAGPRTLSNSCSVRERRRSAPPPSWSSPAAAAACCCAPTWRRGASTSPASPPSCSTTRPASPPSEQPSCKEQASERPCSHCSQSWSLLRCIQCSTVSSDPQILATAS
jgi:hypothetical protein